MAEDREFPSETRGQILPAGTAQIEIVEHGRRLHVHRVTEPELDTLTSGYNSVHMTFFALCVGALIAFAITLFTVPLSDRMFGVFVALVGVSTLGTVFFGVRAKGERATLASLVRQLKEGRRSEG